MKTTITLLFVLIFSFTSLGQKVDAPADGTDSGDKYINYQYNFSFIPPENSKPNKKFNDDTNFVVSYSCSVFECDTPGVFSITNIKKLNVPAAEAVKAFQSKSAQNEIAKALIGGFPAQANATVLYKKYAAYNGRPAVKIHYNFTERENSITGTMVSLYAEELKALITFTFVSSDADSDKWNKIGENAIQSFALISKESVPSRKVIQGDMNITAPALPPPMPPPPSSAPPGRPEKISGGVLNGKATVLPKPVYPPAAAAVRASGAVNVAVTVDEEGNVVKAEAVSGHPLLRKAAEDAALEAKFPPTLLSGAAVKVSGVIVYNFVP